jgi:hypothetical protein
MSFKFISRQTIDKLPEPFRTGVTTSKLWNEEKNNGGHAITNCLSVYLPNDEGDVFLTIRMSCSEGVSICNLLGFGSVAQELRPYLVR